MGNRTIEHFLDSKVAEDYSIKNHHLFKVLSEVFGTKDKLFAHYTGELAEVERFRADLALALAEDSDSQRKLAERWALFLKLRVNVMEFWSGIFTAVAAIFGLATTIFTLMPSATRQSAPSAMLVTLLFVALVSVIIKFHIDKRAFWFKYIIANLEALSKVGTNPAFQGTPRDKAAQRP